MRLFCPGLIEYPREGPYAVAGSACRASAGRAERDERSKLRQRRKPSAAIAASPIQRSGSARPRAASLLAFCRLRDPDIAITRRRGVLVEAPRRRIHILDPSVAATLDVAARCEATGASRPLETTCESCARVCSTRRAAPSTLATLSRAFCASSQKPSAPLDCPNTLRVTATLDYAILASSVRVRTAAPTTPALVARDALPSAKLRGPAAFPRIRARRRSRRSASCREATII